MRPGADLPKLVHRSIIAVLGPPREWVPSSRSVQVEAIRLRLVVLSAQIDTWSRTASQLLVDLDANSVSGNLDGRSILVGLVGVDQLQNVRHHLAERIRVGDEPGMITRHRHDVWLAERFAHVLERGLRDEVVTLTPEHDDGKLALAENVELLGEVDPPGDARRPPEGLGVSDKVRHAFAQNDREDTSGLAYGEQVPLKVDTPVPQGSLRH